MLVPKIKVKRLTPDAILPTKAHKDDMAYDLYTPEHFSIAPLGCRTISVGIAIEMPKGWSAFIMGRSSLAAKGIDILGGVIDNGYRGPIHIIMYNTHRERYYHFAKGDKVMQLVPIPSPKFLLVEVDELTPSDRGEKRFGSSGR